MAKKVIQYSYTKENLPQEGTINIKLDNMLQIGIQTLPGVTFSFDGNSHTIVMGNTGIYEINVEGFTTIGKITFSELDKYSSLNNFYLIVDIIYEDDGGGS